MCFNRTLTIRERDALIRQDLPLRYRNAGFVLLLLAAVCVNACHHDRPETDNENLQVVPLPVLSGEIELRVGVVSNPRFPGLSAQGIDDLLARTAEMVEQQFGIRLSFQRPEAITIQGFFAWLPPAMTRNRGTEIIDISTLDDAGIGRMQDSLTGTLEQYGYDRQQVLNYAVPYLEQPPVNDSLHEIAGALVASLVTRLRYWQHETAADGRPVLDGTPYNEWVWWDSIGYGDMPYDVVITNQLVASAENYSMDVHSALRGGITAGTTSYGKKSRLKAWSWVTLYPLLNDSPLLVTLRDDEHYSQRQVSDYAAAVLTHELGHLLLHLGHPFGVEGCLMSPMPLLKYREWYQGVDVKKCPLYSDEQMRPGAITIDFHGDWP